MKKTMQKKIRKAYANVHAPEELVERMKQELYQQDVHDDFAEDSSQPVTQVRKATLRHYLIYTAAMLALCTGVGLSVWNLRDNVNEFHPGAGVQVVVPPQTSENTASDVMGIVPNVEKLPVWDAVQTLEQAGFLTEIYYQNQAKDTEEGAVIRSEPTSGAEAVPGSTVTLHVLQETRNDGLIDEPAVMIDMTGMNLQQASTICEHEGLYVELAYAAAENPEIIGKVVAQSMTPGSSPISRQKIRLTIASADNSQPDAAGELVTVPDISGYHYEYARKILEQEGFNTSVEYVSTEDGIETGNVIRTEPEGGTQAEAGAEVRLFVSANELETVPDVSGIPFGEAQDFLEKMGFQTEIQYVHVNDWMADTVMRTEPEAGAEVEAGAMINMFVALAKQPFEVPDMVGMSLDQAKTLLDYYGVTVEIIVDDTDTAKGKATEIIAQSIEPSTIVNPEETTITLTAIAGVAAAP